MNGKTYLKEVVEVLEKDHLLLEILGDVLLYDSGNHDIPYSTPLIPRCLRLERLIEYLSSNGNSEFPFIRIVDELDD